jgi:hypothetical protein
MGNINLLPHEHIVKMVVFIEKPPLISSNCYEIMKKCFNTEETWHKWWLEHSIRNSMLNRKFPVTMARGDVSKLPKITILHCFFPWKLILKCCNFSMNWDRVKGYLASVTSYPKIYLRPFLACDMSKIFLAIRGTAAPFKPQNRRVHPPSGSLLMHILDRGRRRKSGHFFKQHYFSNKNKCWGNK